LGAGRAALRRAFAAQLGPRRLQRPCGVARPRRDFGAAGIALNPLHVLFDDRAKEASPYSPNSRLFLNPLYIDVEAVPEFPGLGAAELEQEVEVLRGREFVDYASVARAKMRALQLAYEAFGRTQGARLGAFESFRRAGVRR